MMLWRFQENDEIALTNNEAELAMREYVLWRKGGFCVWSYRGELFRQRIMSLVEIVKRLGRSAEVAECDGSGLYRENGLPNSAGIDTVNSVLVKS